MFCFICLTGRVSHHVCWFVPTWENISISSSCSWFYWWTKGTGRGEVDRAGVLSVSEFSCLLRPSSPFSFQSLPSAAQVGLQWSMETLNWIYKERDWGNLGEAGWQQTWDKRRLGWGCGETNGSFQRRDMRNFRVSWYLIFLPIPSYPGLHCE